MLSNFTATIRQTPPQHRIWDAHWALELEDSIVAVWWRGVLRGCERARARTLAIRLRMFAHLASGGGLDVYKHQRKTEAISKEKNNAGGTNVEKVDDKPPRKAASSNFTALATLTQ
uniref:Uncharacterized protein n=1 Tax=Anopheles merus TaxID=30066 RepID=A0A182V8C8_ANOME